MYESPHRSVTSFNVDINRSSSEDDLHRHKGHGLVLH